MLSFVLYVANFQIGLMEAGTGKQHLDGNGGNGGMTHMLDIMSLKKL